MKVAIKDIKPNPFRDLNTYPIDPDKVRELCESFEQTGFWPNVVGREVKNDEGEITGVEIAYGHHRRQALLEHYENKKPDKLDSKVEIIIEELSNEKMIQMMARENMSEWSGNIRVEMETVRSTINAFGSGAITLDRLFTDEGKLIQGQKAEYLRYAPAVIRGLRLHEGADKAYTINGLAKFLGWTREGSRGGRKGIAYSRPNKRMERSIQALELIDRKILDDGDFQGLVGKEANIVISHTLSTLRRYDGKKNCNKRASKVGKEVAKELRENKQLLEKGRKAAQRADPSAVKIPDINIFAERFIGKILNLVHPARDKLGEEIEAIVADHQEIDLDIRQELTGALEDCAMRLLDYATAILPKQKFAGQGPKELE